MMILHLIYQVSQLKHGCVMRKKICFHRNTCSLMAGKLNYSLEDQPVNDMLMKNITLLIEVTKIIKIGANLLV